MKITLQGSVHYANGDPLSGVSVRIYDKDAEGKGDDDLTVTPGISDESGRFSLTYEPLRYLDYHSLHWSGTTPPEEDDTVKDGLRIPDLGDMYLPYLRFYYTYKGVDREYSTSLLPFQKRFYLQVNPPVDFLPSRNGFKFVNRFSGYFLPYSLPAFMTSRKVSSNYGLCGGMCAATYDFILAGRTVPQDMEVPHQGSRLQRYIFQRQMDSLGGLGHEIVRVAQWTSLPDDTPLGTMRRTADELTNIRLKLDDNNPVVLALIYVKAGSLKELAKVIFSNHQVLAYAYQLDGAGGYTIQVYDPNLPGHDDVTIFCSPLNVSDAESSAGAAPVIGFKSVQKIGSEFYKDVRGFFEMPYKPVIPPRNL